MVDRKVVPFDEFYYQLKLMHLFQKHPVYFLSCRSAILVSNLPRAPELVFLNFSWLVTHAFGYFHRNKSICELGKNTLGSL
jgi:hypothetical protein